MTQVAWTAIGLLAATLLGSFWYLGTKIDAINGRIDALSARMDALSARMDALAARLDARIDGLASLLQTHIERHPS